MNILVNGVILSLYIWSILYNRYLLITYIIVLCCYFVIAYIKSKKALKLTRRKIQIATWNDTGNPTCFAELKLSLENTDEYITEFNKKNPKTPINYSHCVLKSVARAIEINNGKICFGNYIKEESVNLCLILDMKDDKFEYIIVENCNKLSMLDIAKQVHFKIKHNDKKSFFFNMNKIDFFKYIPTWIVQCYLILFSYISYDLNISIPFLGLKKNHFGFGLVINTEPYKIDNIFFPLSYLTKSLVVATINSPKLVAVVREGKVVSENKVNLNITYDHRFADGSDCFKMVRKLHETWDEIWKY